MLALETSALATNKASGPNGPADVVAVKGNIPFRDPVGAGRLLAQVRQQLAPSLATSLPALLEDSPDPDSAVLFFERLISDSPEVVPLLNRHNFLAHYAVVVFGHSRFLGETLVQNVDLLQAFLREKNLDRSFSREEFHEAVARFRARSFDPDVSLLLARFKRREYVRIMLRDVLRLAPMAETVAEISALADVVIEEALQEADRRLQRRYGTPQHVDHEGRLVNTPFAVLSLGKLGGNELNYSSDVDLMYIFGSGDGPESATISNREYFVRLAQEVTEILSAATREGPPFRIDLRLRPQGHEGELAISLSHALDYYAKTAHDWELQALIKVRYSAGDIGLAREFIRGVQPYVYKEDINFAAIKTALEARARMQKRRHPQTTGRTPEIDVKVDRGGIRDIEFLVQCLQRVYGGAEPWLRSHGTMFSLQKLHDKGHLTGKEFHELTGAYVFLRHLEHRLQLRQGQQTHRLPASKGELQVLQRAMDGLTPGEDRSEDLASMVARRMAAISEIYQRTVYNQSARGQLGVPDNAFELSRTLEVSAADQSDESILAHLGRDAPELREMIGQTALSPQGRRNLFRFLGSARSSSERYGAILRSCDAVRNALRLFECSEYLSEISVHYPEEIATLAELNEAPGVINTGYLFESFLGEEHGARDRVFAYVVDADLSHRERLAALRRHYRHRILKAGATDIVSPRDVYSSMAATTAAAEDVINAAFTIAGQPEGLAIMALGRLGSGEFDVLSDADLLFVHDEHHDAVALTKSAEHFMQVLSAYTSDGMVFPVDPRLRPLGSEGDLLSTPTQLRSYAILGAQPWEGLMYTKMRFLGGALPVGARAMDAVQVLFDRLAAAPDFLASVHEMRRKLETSEGDEKNFKTGPGGAYDIDFLTAYLLIRHGVSEKGGNLRDRLWRCAGCGLIDKSDAATLDHAAELLRTVEHMVRLVTGRASKWLPATEHAYKVTEELVGSALNRKFPNGLNSELTETLLLIRQVYERLMCNA